MSILIPSNNTKINRCFIKKSNRTDENNIVFNEYTRGMKHNISIQKVIKFNYVIFGFFIQFRKKTLINNLTKRQPTLSFSSK